MSDTVNLFGSQVKKGYVIAGGIVVVTAVGYGWWKNRQAAAAAPAAAAADTTAAADTGTTAEDLASSGYYDASVYDPASYGGGYGYPLENYGTGGAYYGTTAGYTAYATNGQWAQGAEDYLASTVGADPTTVAAALGKYITGQALSADQVSVVEQAIAFQGYPPVNGTDGYPPSMRQAAAPPPTTTPPPAVATVKVPNVIGQRLDQAIATIQNAGLKEHTITRGIANPSHWKAIGQYPNGGTVKKGSTVNVSAGQIK